MPQVHKTVFINYRRETSGFAALYIYENLKKHGYEVFMDIKNMGPGPFDTTIRNQIKARAHFLAILSPGSLKDCAKPGDWVRHELELAIRHQRNIMPLMTGGFKFEDYQEQLTGKLSELERYAGLNVQIEFIDAAMEYLRERFLNQPVQVTIYPVPDADQPVVKSKLERVEEEPVPTKNELTAEEYFWSGLEKQEAGDLDGAITDYNQAVRLNPQYAGAYNNLGNVYRRQGNLGRAIAYYNRAIRLDPQYIKAYNNRGNARRRQGNLGKAIADYNQALRLDPQYATAYNNRGNVRYIQNDLTRAIADYNQAIQIDLQYAEAYNNRGEAYFAQRQIELALTDFDKFMELCSKSYCKWGIAGRTVTLHALGRIDEAREQWQELIFQDTRFRDAEWVGEELNWHPALVEEARRLIKSL